MDIKIGFRLHDIDATKSKLLGKIKKSLTTTSGTVGFRLCGMKNGVWLKKDDLADLNHKQLLHSLSDFFTKIRKVDRHRLIMQVVEKLRVIMHLVAISNVQLIATSVILIYDADRPWMIDCKIVDFAHSHLHDTPHLDLNYLEGLGNLIIYLERVAIKGL